MEIAIPTTLAEFNAAGADYLPGHLGLTFLKVEPDEVIAEVDIRKAIRSWNGYLHAGTIASLADTCCGYGTVRSLPQGASGFTTIEFKSNFFGSALEGTVVGIARHCTRAAPPRSGTPPSPYAAPPNPWLSSAAPK